MTRSLFLHWATLLLLLLSEVGCARAVDPKKDPASDNPPRFTVSIREDTWCKVGVIKNSAAPKPSREATGDTATDEILEDLDEILAEIPPDTRFCGKVESRGENGYFIAYQDLDANLREQWRIAMGTKDALRPLEILGVHGDPNCCFQIEARVGKERKLFHFAPIGQGETYGDPVDPLPNSATTPSLPKGSNVVAEGVIQNRGLHFVLYEPPGDLNPELISPTSGYYVELLMGPQGKLVRHKVTDTSSFGWGRDYYIETEQGTFVYAGGMAPLFGERIDSFLVDD